MRAARFGDYSGGRLCFNCLFFVGAVGLQELCRMVFNYRKFASWEIKGLQNLEKNAKMDMK